MATQWRRCDALDNVLLGDLGFGHHLEVTLSCTISLNVAADRLHPFIKPYSLSAVASFSSIMSPSICGMWEISLTFWGYRRLICGFALLPFPWTKWSQTLSDCRKDPTITLSTAVLKMILEDVSLNQPRVNLSSATSASLLSPYTCDKITSSVSLRNPANYPSLPVTATLIQGCLHAISSCCISASHLSVSQQEHLMWFFIVSSELCFVPLISRNMPTLERSHRDWTWTLTDSTVWVVVWPSVPRGATD